MAFHQPTRQPTQRVFRPASEDDEPHQSQFGVTRPAEESQTWVLFSPATDAGTTASYLTSTHRSNLTRGGSKLGGLGSLDTIAASSEASVGHQRSDSFIDAAEDEDDAELDSLDSHLPDFRSPLDQYTSSELAPHSTPVLPAHDGLGSFRLEHDGMGADVQNRLYAFEQYNPHRVKRRRESLERERAEFERQENQDLEKIRRIESWRLEHSRYLLEEIQKETRRRRRRSVASVSNAHPMGRIAEDATPDAVHEVDVATQETVEEDWHDQAIDNSTEENDSLWRRITRKVVQDLMGIDGKTLSILFGEVIPDEEDLSATPKASVMLASTQDSSTAINSPSTSDWQIKVLERVAKELGSLVHQLSEHPGAFTTFNRVQQMPIPYAGLPAISESPSYPVADEAPCSEHTPMPEFKPTIPATSRPIDIPQAHNRSNPAPSSSQSQTDNSAYFTQEEWEQDLDVRLVFRYLRSRFLPRSNSSGGISSASHAVTPTLSAQDAAVKAARVRQHHPLVSRSRNVERRKSKSTVVSNPALLRPASSCASQSTRRSVRRSSASSSRHYWDIGGGSVGTGSMIATTGPMGSWGEI